MTFNQLLHAVRIAQTLDEKYSDIRSKRMILSEDQEALDELSRQMSQEIDWDNLYLYDVD